MDKPVTLRKKAPFWCRGENLKCLKVLTAADILDLCPDCAAKFKDAASRPVTVSKQFVRERPAPRFMTEAEWAERLARGPIWPGEYTEDECAAGIEAVADACSSHVGPVSICPDCLALDGQHNDFCGKSRCVHNVIDGEDCPQCGRIESVRRGA